MHVPNGSLIRPVAAAGSGLRDRQGERRKFFAGAAGPVAFGHLGLGALARPVEAGERSLVVEGQHPAVAHHLRAAQLNVAHRALGGGKDQLIHKKLTTEILRLLTETKSQCREIPPCRDRNSTDDQGGEL